MTHYIDIAGTIISVRVTEIAPDVFEAVGRFRNTDLFVKETTAEKALECFRQAAKRKAAE